MRPARVMSTSRGRQGRLTKAFTLLGFLVSGASIVPSAAAMGVKPIQVEMISVGSASRAQITVTNDGAAPLPVEAELFSLTLGEKGEQELKPAGDDFLLLPPQTLIAARGAQVFRLQWVGEPQLQESRSFMIKFNQIPVKPQQGQNAVQIVMSFGVMVNVAPLRGQSNLSVVGTGVEVDPRDGKRRPTITVQNPTKIHALLPQSKIRLTSGAWSQTLEQDFLGQRIGIGLVQPGQRRQFILPVDIPNSVRDIQAALEYKATR